MSIWELYLLLKSPSVMPTYWHGGYIRRKYIFSKSDVESIEALRGKDICMLFSDKKLLPCVTIENKDFDTVDFVEKEYHAVYIVVIGVNGKGLFENIPVLLFLTTK